MSCSRYASNISLRRRLIAGIEPIWLQRHKRRRYIIQAVLASPPWVDREAMRALAQEARFVSAKTNVRHVLDHIVPLTHKKVCGLNVPWNLRIVPYAVNASKSNQFNPNQIPLLLEENQMDLFQPSFNLDH